MHRCGLSAAPARTTGHRVLMMWRAVFDELELTIASRQLLLAVGAHSRMLTAAVRGGALIRVRRDHYALPGTDSKVLRAVRIGGRLACASALRNDGIFGFDDTNTHVHLEREASGVDVSGVTVGAGFCLEAGGESE